MFQLLCLSRFYVDHEQASPLATPPFVTGVPLKNIGLPSKKNDLHSKCSADGETVVKASNFFLFALSRRAAFLLRGNRFCMDKLYAACTLRLEAILVDLQTCWKPRPSVLAMSDRALSCFTTVLRLVILSKSISARPLRGLAVTFFTTVLAIMIVSSSSFVPTVLPHMLVSPLISARPLTRVLAVTFFTTVLRNICVSTLIWAAPMARKMKWQLRRVVKVNDCNNVRCRVHELVECS